MGEAVTRLPLKPEQKPATSTVSRAWQPFEGLRREVERLFDDFDGANSLVPFRRSLFDYVPFGRPEAKAPAVDVIEKEKEYEITAELPGMDEKDIEVKVSNGALTIRGEKKDEREEKNKDYFLSERRYGSFERYFGLPGGIDADKIAASFKKGVLTVTLPKTPQAQKQDKKIAIKAD